MAFGSPAAAGTPGSAIGSTQLGRITTFEYTYPDVAAAATGLSDWVDLGEMSAVSFEFTAAAGGVSATVGLRGALARDTGVEPAAAEFVAVSTTDEAGATAATATVNAASSKILSVPAVHRAIRYWQFNVSANTLGGALTVRVIATQGS